MVATVLFVLVTGGLLKSMIESYRIAAAAKYSTQARAVLRSVADQFLNSNFIDQSLTFFNTTGNATTGTGMAWRRDSNVFSFTPSTAYNPDDYVVGTSAGLVVPLGDQGTNPVQATLTRTVTALSGATPAGQLLRGEFTATFNLGGKEYDQTISVVRSFP
jgi:hypothetical protein